MADNLVRGRRAMKKIVKTPGQPYHAVIFTSLRTEGGDGYARMAGEMMALAPKQPGLLGGESTRDEDGFGKTVSNWNSLDGIKMWREDPSHQAAQKMGKEKWYRRDAVRWCKVERDKIS